MTEAEFSRPIALDTMGSAPRTIEIEADASERAALARRFGLLSVDSLTAVISLQRDGATVSVAGRLQAQVVQSCVVTDEPVPAGIDADFQIAFRPGPEGRAEVEEEVELSEADCDVVFYTGAAIDIGEAVAETLSLALDPWPRAPGAEDALREAGVGSEEEVGSDSPLAKALREKLGK